MPKKFFPMVLLAASCLVLSESHAASPWSKPATAPSAVQQCPKISTPCPDSAFCQCSSPAAGKIISCYLLDTAKKSKNACLTKKYEELRKKQKTGPLVLATYKDHASCRKECPASR